MNLWKFILAFLRPAVDDGAAADAGAADTDQAAVQPELELDFDAAGGDDAAAAGTDDDAAPDPAKQLEAERRARREAEEKATRYEREMAEIRARAPHQPMPNQDDEQRRREDAILSDPKATELEKWTINTNRALRANMTASQRALAEAQDTSDRTAFSQLCATNPMAKKYQSRVEEELRKARAGGQNPSRAAILRYMLGDDMIEGRFARKKAAAAAQQSSTVQRGRLSGARSDVSGRGVSMTDHEKRRARLADVQI